MSSLTKDKSESLASKVLQIFGVGCLQAFSAKDSAPKVSGNFCSSSVSIWSALLHIQKHLKGTSRGVIPFGTAI